MHEKIKIGISSCLLGEHVRYDGGHKRDCYLTDTLGHYVDWVPVCPEVEYGLPIPREAMRLVGTNDSPRLITIKTKIDHTEGMLKWAEEKIKVLEREDLCGFIFKSRSPSSGIRGVKIYSPSGKPSKSGSGIFGGAFMKQFPLLPVEDEGRLQDSGLRENFIERLFVFKRWKEFMDRDRSIHGLVSFHTDHKLLLLAHSPRHYSALGKMAAAPKKLDREQFFLEYIRIVLDGLKMISTVNKNTNVLHHIMGYFKGYISADEKQELLDIIGEYHEGLIPLIVPVTLINHYVRKYDEPYLKRQHYLNPHPVELMLRNHV